MFGNYGNAAKIIENLMELYSGLEMSEDERTAATNALMTARAQILKAQEDEMEEFESHRYDGHVEFDANDLPF